MKSVLILGGYGNFGKRIATALVKADIPIIITGRNKDKAQKLLSVLKEIYPACNIKDDIFDVKLALAERLKELRPAVVINTVGPFQTSNYDVVKICIQHKVHYIDLADGRDFVVGISKLDRQAKKAGVAVISGASTVPGLSSAVLEKYRNEFSVIKSFTYGISPGQKAERGLTTTKAILTYIR